MGSKSKHIGLAVVSIVAIVIVDCRTNQSITGQFDDTAISTRVRARLLGDPRLGSTSISITTDEGEVFLIGRVETRNESLLAEKHARSVEGVWSVLNRLAVGPPPEAEFRDFDLQVSIRQKFTREPDLPSLNIEVVTNEGQVYLIGRVPAERLRNLAHNLVGEMNGVVAIHNYIKVGERATDPGS